MIIFTDGSCIMNTRNNPGGWAALLYDFVQPQSHSKITLWGHQNNTTNNRMELLAVIEALEYVDTVDEPILIHSDSQYVVNGITKWIHKWHKDNYRVNGTTRLNHDLWKRLYHLVYDIPKSIEWKWVKAHSTNENNNYVDRIAREAATKLL